MMPFARVLFSYPREYARFVEHCAGVLRRFLGQSAVWHYTHGDSSSTQVEFNKTLDRWMKEKEKANVCLLGLCRDGRVTHSQFTELEDWQGHSQKRTSPHPVGLFVDMPDASGSGLVPVEMNVPLTGINLHRGILDAAHYVEVTDVDQASAERLAEYLLRKAFGLPPKKPTGRVFTYEKDIITAYSDLYRSTDDSGRSFLELDPAEQDKFLNWFRAGLPMIWPSIRVRTSLALRVNELIPHIGDSRPGLRHLTESPVAEDCPPKCVAVSALQNSCHPALSFLEAGPRQRIAAIGRVGIVVTGGIAPGINAVIDGIVKRHKEYANAHCFSCEIRGFEFGFHGLSQARTLDVELLDKVPPYGLRHGQKVTSEYVSRGGSMIGTIRLSRLDEDPDNPQDEAVQRINREKLDTILNHLRALDVLYVIGGDGSMKMANMLLSELRKRGIHLTVVGIPKTMDNDILWVWQSFGFATAVEKARDIIDCLSIEKESNHRICIVQLFGSVSGFVVSHAVLASQSGQCDAALIPEDDFSIAKLAEVLRQKNGAAAGGTVIPQGMVVMAETAVPKDWQHYVACAELTPRELESVKAFDALTRLGGKKQKDRYFEGQTSDDLRSAGLKLVQKGLEMELGKHYPAHLVRTFTNEPRQILRASHPSFADIIFGQRLGTLAVDNAVAGYGDFMVSQWLTEFVLVPLRLVSVGRKRIHEDGIFWKSVLAKTGQGKLV